MKFLVTFSLAGLFLFNSIGYQILFGILFYEQHSEMNSCLNETDNKSLEKIVINSSNHSDFFVVNENEIFYKGCLYDVKHKESNGDIIIYNCKKDEKELDLLSHFIRMNDESKEGSRKNPLSSFLQKTIQVLYFQKFHPSDFQLPSFEFCYSAFTIQYNQPTLNLITPPPQYSLS